MTSKDLVIKRLLIKKNTESDDFTGNFQMLREKLAKIFTNSCKIQKRKKHFSTPGKTLQGRRPIYEQTQLSINIAKIKLYQYLGSNTKFNSKWIKDIKVKTKTTKLL